MYKINYDRMVSALWDPELKEELFDLFFLHFPDTTGMPRHNRLLEAKIMGASIVMGQKMMDAMGKYLLEMECPDPFELKAFLKRHGEMMQIQVNKILDQDAIEEESRRRGLIR